MKTAHLIVLALSGSIIALTGCNKEPAGKPLETGAVYIMDNAAEGNHVLAFSREANGSLYPAGKYATNGDGTGSGLGSQGSLIMYGKYIYACNAGSNEITVFSVTDKGLKWMDKISSNGSMPVSLAIHNDLLYVLNAGKTSNISGFRVKNNGHLARIQYAERQLSSAMAGGAQVAFKEDGTQLVVTEKANNIISTYPVYANGVAGPLMAHPSAGKTPFGFQFTKNDVIIVSEAAGGEPGKSTLSSYKVKSNGNVQLITGPVATHQTAACWVVATEDGRYTYSTNTGSASISGFKISNSGALTLLDANGVTAVTGAGPIDMSLSKGSEYLYTLNSQAHSISCFKVTNNGGLTSIKEITGIPEGAAGMAAN